MLNNRIKQDWLEKVLVSTISLDDPDLRAMDSSVELLSGLLGAEGTRPGLETQATDYQYETMVFEQEEGEVTNWSELACRRYQTKAEALKGHKELVKEYSSKAL